MQKENIFKIENPVEFYIRGLNCFESHESVIQQRKPDSILEHLKCKSNYSV